MTARAKKKPKNPGRCKCSQAKQGKRRNRDRKKEARNARPCGNRASLPLEKGSKNNVAAVVVVFSGEEISLRRGATGSGRCRKKKGSTQNIYIGYLRRAVQYLRNRKRAKRVSKKTKSNVDASSSSKPQRWGKPYHVVAFLPSKRHARPPSLVCPEAGQGSFPRFRSSTLPS